MSMKRPYKYHGQSRTRLYKVWGNMKSRCENPRHVSYPGWGGRGISICPEWVYYEGFHRWAMSSGYCEGLSLDRIDNNGNYGPDNCRWATPKQQANNTRRTIYITLDGRTDTIEGWCEKLGLAKPMVRDRYYRGWDNERMLTLPGREYCKRAGG